VTHRLTFLHWVLVACELTPDQREVVDYLSSREPSPPSGRRGTVIAPTMVYRKAVDSFEALPMVEVDGQARVALDTGITFISVLGLGWVPLKE
jgi:hypothetical protein